MNKKTYNDVMSEKSDNNIHFNDFRNLIVDLGFDFIRQNGSHMQYFHRGHHVFMNIQNDDSKAKGFIVTKQEQLIEYNIQDIIEYMVQDLQIEYDEAMRIFYNSQTFDKLTDIETGLYLESSAYVYGIFQDERNFGKLIQMEI